MACPVRGGQLIKRDRMFGLGIGDRLRNEGFWASMASTSALQSSLAAARSNFVIFINLYC
jgi:hypothetical protein